MCVCVCVSLCCFALINTATVFGSLRAHVHTHTHRQTPWARSVRVCGWLAILTISWARRPGDRRQAHGQTDERRAGRIGEPLSPVIRLWRAYGSTRPSPSNAVDRDRPSVGTRTAYDTEHQVVQLAESFLFAKYSARRRATSEIVPDSRSSGSRLDTVRSSG